MSRNRYQHMKPTSPQVVFNRSHALRTIGGQIESNASTVNSMGLVITPKTSIREAINTLGNAGGRILLSEGVWTFYGALSIDKPVELVSMSPGMTTFKRPAENTAGMVVVNIQDTRSLSAQDVKRGVVISGIRFDDRTTTSSVPSILSLGSMLTVKDCLVVSGPSKAAVPTFQVYGKSWATFIGNVFADPSPAGHHIFINSASSYNQVLNNKFDITNSSYASVYLDDAVTNSVIVGNVAATDGKYSVKTGNGNTVVGNFGTVTSR